MTDKIRWFRCVTNQKYWLTHGKIYPAVTVDHDGDLAVVDDDGDTTWVVITTHRPGRRFREIGDVNEYFEEVGLDEMADAGGERL